MASSRIAIILAEHGRPSPDVTQYRETWPEAEIQVYHGNDLPDTPELDPSSPRYGWRMNDYFKVRKMLDSGADIAMCFDSDMWIVDREAARTLVPLADNFGLCLPLNPRYSVRRDVIDGADVSYQTANVCLDDSPVLGYGPGVNCSPIAINLSNKRAVAVAEQYCFRMLQEPTRGPLAWWQAMWDESWAPLILPPQYCVCERHIGIGGEIILHHGHEAVKRHYGYRRVS